MYIGYIVIKKTHYDFTTIFNMGQINQHAIKTIYIDMIKCSLYTKLS